MDKHKIWCIPDHRICRINHHRVDLRVLDKSSRELLGDLDEPLASRVKMLGGKSMVGSHADGSDTEK